MRLNETQMSMFPTKVRDSATLWSCDIESTGLLEHLNEQGESARLHNFGAKQGNTEILFSAAHNSLDHRACPDIRPLSELQQWLTEGHSLVMHNGMGYDGEALKFFGYDVSNNYIVDTMYLAWYLEPRRMRYGLEYYGEEFGIPKPPIMDWINGPQEEYNRRVMQDCRIQEKLWDKLWNMLLTIYGNEVESWRLIDYLMIKSKHLVSAQRTKWKLNIPGAEELSAELHVDKEIRHKELVAVMPKVPLYKDKKRCAKPFKGNGSLSSHGIKWVRFCLQYGIDFNSIEEYKWHDGYNEGNPNAHGQIKEWLFDLGWQPETFVYKTEYDEYGKRKERKIPQINVKNSGGLLDPDIVRMLDDHIQLKFLEGLGIVNHRISIVDGWLRDHINGYLIAGIGGLTNTLRLKHREVVNVPSDRVPYGSRLRALLIADEGYVSLGSDLSSLEDRCKHHYQIPLDPEYVKEQSHADFDPHLLIAGLAGLVSDKDIAEFKLGLNEDNSPVGKLNKDQFKHIKKSVRPKGKATNYGCQYGAGAKNISRQAKVSFQVAELLHAAYWEANWSIKEIAASTEVKAACGEKWQRNTVNGIWYWLKAEKDRFSTLCQGTGSFVFDMWLEQVFVICQTRWKRDPQVHAQFHDEFILKCKSNLKDLWSEVVMTAIAQTNGLLGMRREMNCDVQFGVSYDQIH